MKRTAESNEFTVYLETPPGWTVISNPASYHDAHRVGLALRRETGATVALRRARGGQYRLLAQDPS